MSPLVEVEAFVAVAEHGSFVAAADAMGISSSYASKLVSRLEKRLGARLLHRTTRRLTLTDHGERYLAGCRLAFDALQQSEQDIRRAEASVRGRLRLTAPTGLGLGLLSDPLAEFAARHSELELDVVYLDRLVDLVGERFDLAIRAGALSDSSLIGRRIALYCKHVVASPALLAEHGPLTHPDDLRGLPIVRYSGSRAPGKWVLHRGDERVELRMTWRVSANSGRAIAGAASRGLGLAFVPTFHSAAFEADGRLVRVVPDWGQPVPVHALRPSGRQPPFAVRALTDFLTGVFRDLPRLGAA